MMELYRLEWAWLEQGWERDVEVTVSPTGEIVALEPGRTDSTGLPVSGWVLPGMSNVHSHAFQWAFAGLTERRTSAEDSFWTWREQMYASLARLDPESYHALARQLYRQMRRSGYTAVGEFHYVHGQSDGSPYGELAAMSRAVIEAARAEGIAICHLPVLYQRGGFDGRELAGNQRRFFLSDDQFFDLCRELDREYRDDPHVVIGGAFHSLRAVAPERMRDWVSAFRGEFGRRPLHIHVAEQQGEVEACQRAHGCRPLELLFDSVEVNEDWCLIHATHASGSETEQLAESGATIGLCPTTEANLGDGIFSGAEYLAAGGRGLAIGSDSQISVAPFSELRLLEYGQRLRHQKRVVLADADGSCGQTLWRQAAEAGGRAIGLRTGRLAVGWRADWVVVDPERLKRPGLEVGRPDEAALDRILFCEPGPIVTGTHSGASWLTGSEPG